MFDFIGDVHGHADELETLLRKLSFEKTSDGYRHPERTAVFVGDLIDRGPKIRQVIDIVRPMVESGAAQIVMGNHEFNALCFNTPRADGRGYLRERSEKNIAQHSKTLQAYEQGYEELLEWFMTLPLWIEHEAFRVVHACWDDQALKIVREHLPGGTITKELLHRCADESDPLGWAIDRILKGPEAKLPSGHTFRDKDGHERDSVRVRWFEPSSGRTYRDYSFQAGFEGPEEPLEGLPFGGYPSGERPVFFGHYWLSASTPVALRENCFCLDYSVAKGGFLAAYRMGEGFVVS